MLPGPSKTFMRNSTTNSSLEQHLSLVVFECPASHVTPVMLSLSIVDTSSAQGQYVYIYVYIVYLLRGIAPTTS